MQHTNESLQYLPQEMAFDPRTPGQWTGLVHTNAILTRTLSRRRDNSLHASYWDFLTGLPSAPRAKDRFYQEVEQGTRQIIPHMAWFRLYHDYAYLRPATSEDEALSQFSKTDEFWEQRLLLAYWLKRPSVFCSSLAVGLPQNLEDVDRYRKDPSSVPLIRLPNCRFPHENC